MRKLLGDVRAANVMAAAVVIRNGMTGATAKSSFYISLIE